MFQHYFLNFWWFWPPKTTPKSNFVCTFFENVDFVKIVLSPRRRAYFQGSELFKKHQKSMPKRIRKKHHKKALQISILASVLASQNLPKSTQHRKKCLRKKAQKKEPWESPRLNARQAFWDPAGPSNHLSND